MGVRRALRARRTPIFGGFLFFLVNCFRYFSVVLISFSIQYSMFEANTKTNTTHRIVNTQCLGQLRPLGDLQKDAGRERFLSFSFVACFCVVFLQKCFSCLVSLYGFVTCLAFDFKKHDLLVEGGDTDAAGAARRSATRSQLWRVPCMRPGAKKPFVIADLNAEERQAAEHAHQAESRSMHARTP